MSEAFIPWLADALIILGLIVMTIAVYGMVWLPDLYLRLHAASKAVFLGAVPFLVAAGTTGQPAVIFRAILIGAFLLLTTTVAAHAICCAAYHQKEPMQTPDRLDETGRLAASSSNQDTSL